MKKNILGVAAGLGLILVAAFPVFAVDNCTNGTTGPDSWNVCGRISVRLNRLPVTNRGTVNQTITSTAQTGNNTSNDNTVGADVVNSVNTGAAEISGIKGAQLNTVDALVDQTGNPLCPDCDTGTVTGTNNVTGPDSVNVIAVVDVKAVSVEVNNNGTVNQTIRSRANTGDNTVNHNTIAGGIKTGNATVNETVTTMLNDTFVTIYQ